MPDPLQPEPESDSEQEGKSELAGKRATFFSELKRRNVFRAAGTYTVVAWLVIQVAAATFPGFGVPNWVFRFVVIGLVLGFPIAVVLAWAFELTPDGVKRTDEVDAEKERGQAGGVMDRRRYPIALAALVPTLIFGGLAGYFYFDDRQVEGPAVEVSETRPYVIGSLVVLPFDVIASEGDLAVMAEALHEELLTELSHMEPLDVVSRTTSLKYANTQLSTREIGEELGSDFVVEGSVQKLGDTIRLTLQLIDSESDLHLDSLTYDVELAGENRLLQQRLLAWRSGKGIYERLSAEHPVKGQAELVYAKRKETLEAELRGYEEQFWATEDGDTRRKLYGPLMELIDRIGGAYPLSGDVYRKRLVYLSQASMLGLEQFMEWSANMGFVVEQALEMIPDHYETQIHVGSYYLYALARPDISVGYYERGLQLYEASDVDPNNWPYCHLSRAYMMTGRPSLALKVLDRVPLDPGFEQLEYWTMNFELARRFEDGIEFLDTQIKRAIEAGNVEAELRVSLQRAQFACWWSGTTDGIDELYASVKDREGVTDGYRVSLLFWLGRYDEVLELIEVLDPRYDSFAPDPFTLMSIRGVSLRETGELELSQSYLEKTVVSLKAQTGAFATKPGVMYSILAVLEAYCGFREEALKAIEMAEANLDASRNLPEHYLAQGWLARAFFELGEYERVIDRLEFMLSGRSGACVGRVMRDFRDEELRGNEKYEALLRRNASQLKDPAVLDDYFSASE